MGHPVFIPRRPVRALGRWLVALLQRDAAPEPTYTFFSDLSYQVVRDGLASPGEVRRRVQAELAFVRRFRPDVLIGHGHLLMSTIGRLAGLPVVQVTQAFAHPDAPSLVWWQELPEGWISPDIRPVFEPVLSGWGLPPVQRGEDLLGGDLVLVHSIPELDPLPDGLSNTHHVGELALPDQVDVPLPGWLTRLWPDKPVVYVTVGGGAASVGSYALFETVNAAFEGLGVEVLVSTGQRFRPTDLPPPPANVHYHRWVPGPAVIARSQCVVFHGGHRTMMETVRFGVPSVVIPSHTEQESNGKRLAAAGAAAILVPDPATLQLVQVRWAGREFTFGARYSPFLSADVLRTTVQRVLRDMSFQRQAERLQQSLSLYGGPVQAANLVEDFLRVF